MKSKVNVVTDARVGMTLTAFRGIAQAVAGLPGRKSLVWVSGAFPYGHLFASHPIQCKS